MAVTVRRTQHYEPHIAIPCHTLFETAVFPGQFTAVIGEPYCLYAGLVVAFDLYMTLPLRAEAPLYASAWVRLLKMCLLFTPGFRCKLRARLPV